MSRDKKQGSRGGQHGRPAGRGSGALRSGSSERPHHDTAHSRSDASSRRGPQDRQSRAHAPARRTAIVPPSHADFVIGRNAAQEVLRYAPERILRAYIVDGRARELFELFESASVPVEAVSTESLADLVANEAHQSIVLAVKPRVFRSFGECLKGLAGAERGLVVVLDGVEDPQNFGAILRSAECFGADLILWSKNRGASLTPAVTKASVGASELLNLCSVSNINDALMKLRDEAGFWIVCADVGEGATPLAGFEFPAKTVLVLGAEGSGISHLVSERADFRVEIALSGRINSLNVAQAGAILMHAYAARQCVPVDS